MAVIIHFERDISHLAQAEAGTTFPLFKKDGVDTSWNKTEILSNTSESQPLELGANLGWRKHILDRPTVHPGGFAFSFFFFCTGSVLWLQRQHRIRHITHIWNNVISFIPLFNFMLICRYQKNNTVSIYYTAFTQSPGKITITRNINHVLHLNSWLFLNK